METQAYKFASAHTDTNELMTALDNANLPSNQDWENESTTWTFADESTVTISGDDITAA